MLHLLQPNVDCNECLSGATQGAFRNPYFGQQQQTCCTSTTSIRISPTPAPTCNANSDKGDLDANITVQWDQDKATQDVASRGLLKTAPQTADEQMHFIENHIANLHSRQVTSSVKELSSLGE